MGNPESDIVFSHYYISNGSHKPLHYNFDDMMTV